MGEVKGTIPGKDELDKLPRDGGENYNRLVFEQSPYLLQHASNPVDWFPWGEEAFQKASGESKPVFLSIGYATCHWCHVMERESFEDEEVAALLNRFFVAIKVDREERPDIDQVYMAACQMMTGSGGWPLTCFLTPGKDVFFAATYFPKQGRQGRTGMMELLPAIADAWQNRPGDVMKGALEFKAALETSGSNQGSTSPGEKTSEQAFRFLNENYDESCGGFGNAPKFPVPHQHYFLLRYWKSRSEEKALDMTIDTLTAMRRGGIYDHIGFGFHRYSTDRKWLVPHFEKMLYDQALLLQACSEAAVAGNSSLLRETAREIIEYLKYRLENSEGAFFSAEDADSEGVEGKFYTWHLDELKQILDDKELQDFTATFQIKEKGNFAEEATGQLTGANIPHKIQEKNGGGSKGESLEDPKAEEEIRKKLFVHREQRIHPLLDDKILTDWNGLAIASLARTSLLLNSDGALAMAQKAFDFIDRHLKAEDGSLVKRYRAGVSGLPAHLDDYAFMIRGALELHQATLEHRYLAGALNWTGLVIERFHDDRGGGFFFTGAGTELSVRRKEAYDGALPSGNGVMACNLAHLYHLTGNAGYREYFDKLAGAFGKEIQHHPAGYSYFLTALELMNAPVTTLVFSGSGIDRNVLEPLLGNFLPFALWLSIEENSREMKSIAPFTEAMTATEATLYSCRNFSCSLPVSGIENIQQKLKEIAAEN